MTPVPRAIFWRRFHVPASLAVCLILFYLYVWLRIDPRLHHHVMDPRFFLGRAFLKEYMLYPGGPAKYLCAFLVQFWYFPWLGALILTSIALLLCLATGSFITRVSGTRVRLLRLVPAVLLLMLHSRYNYPVVNTSVGVLIVLLFLAAYVRVPLQGTLPRLILFLILSAVLYYFVAAPYLLFAILGGMFELVGGRRFLLGVACLLFGLLLPYATATYLFGEGIAEAYTASLYLSPAAIPAALYLFVPLATVATVVLRWLPLGAKRQMSEEGETPPPAASAEPRRTPGWKSAFAVVAFFAAAAIAVGLSFDRNDKAMVLVDYYAQQRMWPELLQEASRLRACDPSSIINIDRALYHTGRLAYDMFSFPQARGLDIFPVHDQASRWALTMSDLFLDLGHLSYAEKWAYEALEIRGDHPMILRRLVIINTLKAWYQAARTFLNMLKKNFLYTRWAERYLQRLDTDPGVLAAEELKRIGSTIFSADHPNRYLTPEGILEQILRVNRRNQMAFEYLMAHYLLSSQLDKLVQNLPRLNDFGYTDIPRHYQEALLIYQMTTPFGSVDLQGRTINPGMHERFKSFGAALLERKGDMAAAREALAKEYGHTYWYFWQFGRTALGQAIPPTAAEE